MKELLLKCRACGRYSLSEACPGCEEKTSTAHPARYSPDDRYARYRSPLAYKT